jgi:RND family efflux transporter MFP subunit
MRSVFVLAAVVCSGLLVGCRPPSGPPEGTAVRVASVERAGSAASRHYSAQIQPASHVDLSFRYLGYVEEIARVRGLDGTLRVIQEGDAVRRGMELARLRTPEFTQRVEEAQATFAKEAAAAALAENDLKRFAELAAGGLATEAQVDAVRSQHARALATLAEAKARLEQSQTAAAEISLKSPIDGVVLKRFIEVGSLSGPNPAHPPAAVAMVVADMTSVKAGFGVPDVILSQVQLGAPQSITTEAYPNVEFHGRITRISPSADPQSRVFEIEVTIPNRERRLKSGMVAGLRLDQGKALASADQPLVPLSSVVRPPGRADGFAVFVVEQAGEHLVARVREVELGEYLGRVIPVNKGLKGGERVVVQGAGLLSDGEAIEVIR